MKRTICSFVHVGRESLGSVTSRTSTSSGVDIDVSLNQHSVLTSVFNYAFPTCVLSYSKFVFSISF